MSSLFRPKSRDGISMQERRTLGGRRRIPVVVAMVVVVIGGGHLVAWAAQHAGLADKTHYASVSELLTRKDSGWLPKGFDIIILSNMAEGLVNYACMHPERQQEVASLLTKVVALATAPPVARYRDVFRQSELGTHGLYLAHVNIILGCHQRIAGDGAYGNLNRRISEHLARWSLSESDAHIRSFSNEPFKYPADQAAVLYSLYLHDKNYDAELGRAPCEKWLGYMHGAGTDAKTGLPLSEVTGRASYSRYPRGCAMSWTVRYMARFAPDEAKALWRLYKNEFKVGVLGAAAFREYPRGVELPPDVDSGPIVMGMGAAATALALGAARSVGDSVTFYQLANLFAMAETGAAFASEMPFAKTLKDQLEGPLGLAVRFRAETETAWW